MAGCQVMSRELDQVMSQYRSRIQTLSTLWQQNPQLRQLSCFSTKSAENAAQNNIMCDVTTCETLQEMVSRLDQAVTGLMEREVRTEQARQAVLNLSMVLDVSQQTVEAKSKHLVQEEKQKEEEQQVKLNKFQKIHKLQADKCAIEKELIPLTRRFNQVIETLQEKSEKMRNLEQYHSDLVEHCADDMLCLKDRTDIARAKRALWDSQTADIGREIRAFSLDKEELLDLDKSVSQLKQIINNYRNWHEEEMQTKLFLSTRSKEIKQRLSYYKSLLRRLEKGVQVEDVERGEAGCDSVGLIGSQTEHLLADGTPGVNAKEVEKYMSQQLGISVMADYTMLRRLKEEIGVPGLAYLVEKIRLQAPGDQAPFGYGQSWGEKNLEQAVRNIALEYRQHDENKRLMAIPGLAEADNTSSHSDIAGGEAQHRGCGRGCGGRLSPSLTSEGSRYTGTISPSRSAVSSTSSRRSSTASLRRKGSLAKIKKLLKF